MKHFRVEEEFVSAIPRRVEVSADGSDIEGTDYETDDYEYIVLGYTVYEEDEQGITQNVEFYPVQTDTRTFRCNADEVLAQIRQDYPASEWQNNNW